MNTFQKFATTLLGCWALTLLSAYGWQAGQPVLQAPVVSATVYQQGALLEHKANLNLVGGTNNIVIGPVSNPDPKSIQALLNGYQLTMLGVRVEAMNRAKLEEIIGIKNLQDSIALLDEQVEAKADAIQVFEEEQQLIKENRKVGTEQTGTSASAVAAMADFYRKRINNIKAQTRSINKEIAALQKQQAQLNERLNKLYGQARSANQQIVVTIDAPSTQKAQLLLQYVTRKAAWSIFYDIRSKGLDQPLSIAYNAEVSQQTGLNWQNVKLTLATGYPLQNSDKPDIPVQRLAFLRFQQMQKRKMAGRAMAAPEAPAPVTDGVSADNLMVMESAVPTAAAGPRTTLSEGMVRQFTLEPTYSIKHNDQAVRVTLGTNEAQAKYYYAVPATVAQNAYLQAAIQEWEKYKLLSGPAQIFYEGRYVASSYIDASGNEEILDISLGKDPRIAVSREVVKAEKGNKGLSDKNIEEQTVELVLRNTTGKKVSIRLEDRIPVSGEKDLKIELLERSGAQFDAEKGQLKWVFELGSEDRKTFRFTYKLTYPKDKRLRR